MHQDIGISDKINFMINTLSCIGDGVIATNREGIILFMNASGEKLTGWSANDIIGKHIDEVFHVVDYFTKERLPSPITLSLDNDSVAGFQNHVALMTKDEITKFVSASFSPIKNPHNEPEGTAVVFRDIHHFKNGEATLQRGKDEVEFANKIKSEFLAKMSHEIRTPINGIIGMMDLLLLSELNEEQTDNVNLAKFSAVSLLKSINDIIDFSRNEAGKLIIEKVNFDVRNLIDHSVIAERSDYSPNMFGSVRLRENGKIVFIRSNEAISKKEVLFEMEEIEHLISKLQDAIDEKQLTQIEETANHIKKIALRINADGLMHMSFKVILASRKRNWTNISEYSLNMKKEFEELKAFK